MVNVPSPAIAIVGRHNSGKTTLIEKLIAEMVARGHDVGSVKHHSHVGFDIDYPGKDSYRHRAAGASETVIAAPGQMARIKTIPDEGEIECDDIVHSMPGHDIIIVEGYRKSGLPTIEIMRAANPRDTAVAHAFAQGAREGWQLGTDFIQESKRELGEKTTLSADDPVFANAAAALAAERSAEAPSSAVKIAAADAADSAVAPEASEASAAAEAPQTAEPSLAADLGSKMPTQSTVAIVTDIPEAAEAAAIYGIPSFHVNDVEGLATFLEAHYVRPRVTVVIQAGGESRRMGRSKATVPFAGRPLICRLVERLSPVADDLVITTNEPDNLAFLHTEFPDLRIQLVCDAYKFRGALPGLYTAMQAATNPFVAIVACDMLFASPSLVVAEALAMAETDADVVVPVNKHGFEPFHAMYRRMNCLPAVRRALDRGEKRAQAFFDDPEVNVLEFPQNKVLEAEPMGGCFVNANTPEELHALEDSFMAQ